MSPPPRTRILITRAPHQASDLAAQLAALGAEAILIPTIELGPPTSFHVLDQALEALLHTAPGAAGAPFDWLLFTSANAVHSFDHRRSALAERVSATSPTALRPLRSTRIAAIGPATARALTSYGLAPDLVPPQAVAESLAQALLPYINRAENRPTRILLIRAEVARDTLPETLRAVGADLTIAPAYRTLIPSGSIPQLQALFATPAHWPDAITFTSSSTALNLFALLEAAGLTLPTDDPSPTARRILRASIGPITSQTLRDLGYPPHLEAPAATVASLAQTLATHLHLSAPAPLPPS